MEAETAIAAGWPAQRRHQKTRGVDHAGRTGGLSPNHGIQETRVRPIRRCHFFTIKNIYWLEDDEDDEDDVDDEENQDEEREEMEIQELEELEEMLEMTQNEDEQNDGTRKLSDVQMRRQARVDWKPEVVLQQISALFRSWTLIGTDKSMKLV